MKRVLLSCTLLFAVFFVKSQVLFNEIWYNPQTGNNEYIELYNPGFTDNLDNYTIVSFYKTVTSGVDKSGFIVLNLPSKPILHGEFAVLASKMPFKHQGQSYLGGGARDIDWSTLTDPATGGYIWDYQKVGNGYNKIPVTDMNNILSNLGNDAPPAIFITLLYKGNVIVNGLAVGVGTKEQVSQALINMPDLELEGNGGIINFANLGNKEIEYLGEGIGVDNGAHRTADGRCGTWAKTSRPADDTPNSTNGPSAPGSSAITVGGEISCDINTDGTRTAKYFIVNASTAVDAYPLILQLYQDNGTNSGQLDAADQILGEKEVLTAPASGEPNTIYTASLTDKSKNTLVVARSTAGCYITILPVSNSCIVAPVTFSVFIATRNKQEVSLKWQTATEQNNRGFNVQRNTRGVWENIAFVFSAADGGNSTDLLSYELKDVNSEKGVSQYRIQQVDLDGKASYSAIRSVKGLGEVSRTVVYPNPSIDGKVSVVFDDQAAKAVTVSDMSGRVVRQYHNVINNLQISGLHTGMYSIQITDLSSAATTTEKVIIKKR